MTKISVVKYSFLGLILMGCSALIAAILPSKAAKSLINSVNYGVLMPFSCGSGGNMQVYSCCEYPQTANCHVTANSGTGITSFLVTASGNIYDTLGNTSFSNSQNAVDTTSALVRIQ